MDTLLLLILLFATGYVFVSLIKPLPLFGNRLNTAVVGLPLLFIIFGFFVGTTRTANRSTTTQVVSQQTAPEAQTTKNPEKITNDIANADVTKIQQIENVVVDVRENLVGKAISAEAKKIASNEPSATRVRTPDLDIAALTYTHRNLKRRVTFQSPRNIRLFRDEFSNSEWTVQSDFIDVICFEDGINAVITGIDGKYYAQNGKAKQFTRFEDQDGLQSKSGKVIQILKTGSPVSGPMHRMVVTKSFEMCPQKSLDEISKAVQVAAEGKPSANAELTSMEGVKSSMDMIGKADRNFLFARLVRGVGSVCTSITRELHVGNFDQSVWYAVQCDADNSYMITIATDGQMSSRVTDCAVMELLNIKCFQKIN